MVLSYTYLVISAVVANLGETDFKLDEDMDK